MAKHHPDLVLCRKQPGIAIGRVCEKCKLFWLLLYALPPEFCLTNSFQATVFAAFANRLSIPLCGSMSVMSVITRARSETIRIQHPVAVAPVLVVLFVDITWESMTRITVGNVFNNTKIETAVR
jgi:PHF5-like protein